MSFYRRRAGPGETRKYGNKKQKLDGFTFDSIDEMNRYCILKTEAAAGKIFNLGVKPAFWLKVNGVRIFERPFHPDFAYTREPALLPFAWTNANEVELWLGEPSTPIKAQLRSVTVIEDCKGFMASGDDATRRFEACRKLVLALYGIEITVIQTEKTVRSQERRAAKRSLIDHARREQRKIVAKGGGMRM